MTDDQIKQNAANYIDSLRDDNDMGKFDSYDIEEAYIKGVQSRDEEIEQLKNDYHDMFCVLANKVEQLRNQWHKTDDDLPKDGVHYQMKDGEFLCGKPMLLHICEDDDDSGDDYKGYFDGKFWRYWDKPMSCDVVRGKVTHWMLIPELKKGEQEYESN